MYINFEKEKYIIKKKDIINKYILINNNKIFLKIDKL